MLRRCACHPADNTAQPLLDQLFQTPTGAISRQHRKVMQMQETTAMCLRNLLVIYFTQPVIGCDSAGIGKNQAADTHGDRGIFLHSPVFFRPDITVDQLLVIQQRIFGVSRLLMLRAIQNICLGGLLVSAFHQRQLDGILNLLDGGLFPRHIFQIGSYNQLDCPCHRGNISDFHFPGSKKSLGDCILNFFTVKRRFLTISLNNGFQPYHTPFSLHNSCFYVSTLPRLECDLLPLCGCILRNHSPLFEATCHINQSLIGRPPPNHVCAPSGLDIPSVHQNVNVF